MVQGGAIDAARSRSIIEMKNFFRIKEDAVNANRGSSFGCLFLRLLRVDDDVCAAKTISRRPKFTKENVQVEKKATNR